MKGRITLTGISVNASHGVYGFEKTGVHPFVADAVLYTDKMCGSDNLCRTYDYSKAAEIISGELGGKSVDLIETLATPTCPSPRTHALRACVWDLAPIWGTEKSIWTTRLRQ